MNYAILLSGGTGTRTGADKPKQYVRVQGHMMITYALKHLTECENIYKVVITADESWRDEIVGDAEKAGISVAKICGFAEPGDTRQLSILNAIEFIHEISGKIMDGDDDTVLIHDAARPYITQELIKNCYAAITGFDGVMPALPMKDTVYISEDGKGITGLLDRSRVYAGQAPELFRLQPYYIANLKLLPSEIYKINGASEPAVMAGMNIAVIPGDEKNAKVTSAGDLKKFIEENS